ncbi:MULTISPECIES: autotransporter domain-containing protein [unclassified Achromobacter]|uniref:autotransporter outer membrane beta-barrel domain-containing protein n=1 Tax=unclassified Achromobacter TaxID=2626865 RepID=UPI0013034FC3|nr:MULTISPECIES: autotransporter outer membrane beta-barrel domain-containing protein [unclassified Achromobacter]
MSEPGAGGKDERDEPMDITNRGRLLIWAAKNNNYSGHWGNERKVGKLISEGSRNTVISQDSANPFLIGGPVRLDGTQMRLYLHDLPHRIEIEGDLTMRNVGFNLALFSSAQKQIRDGQEILSILVHGKADDSKWFGPSEFVAPNDLARRETNKDYELVDEKVVRADGKTAYVLKFRKKKDVPAYDVRRSEVKRHPPPGEYIVTVYGKDLPKVGSDKDEKDPPVTLQTLPEPDPGKGLDGNDGKGDVSAIYVAGAVLEKKAKDADQDSGQVLPPIEILEVEDIEDIEAEGETADSVTSGRQESIAEDPEADDVIEVVVVAQEASAVDADHASAEGEPAIVPLANFVTTPNQKSVAQAVDSLPASHPVSEAARAALAQAPRELASFSTAISGEVHPTVGASLRTAVEPVRDVSMAQLRAGLFGGRQPGALTADAGVSDAPALAGVLPSSTIYPAWAQVTGNWQQLGGRDHSAKGRQHSGGVFIGMDEAIGDGWRMGGALGYTDSRLNVSSLGSSANISSYSAILYGGKVLPAGPGAVHMMLGGAYTWHDVRTKRRVSGGGLDQDLRGDYGANTTQLFAELGYAIPVTPALTVQPYVGVSQANNRRRAFKERGGSAALSSKRQHSDTTTVTLGVRGTQGIKLGRHEGQVSGALGWRRNSGDLRTRASMSFDVGDSFTVTGAPVTRDSLLVETGFKVHVGKSAAVGVNYAGQFGGGTRDHSASLNVSWRF